MKKILLLVLVMTVLFGEKICKAQSQNKIDSLESVLKTAKDDTSKINALNDLARELSSGNPDTALILSNEALQLSEKSHWQTGIAQSYLQIGWANENKGDYSLSLQFYQKAVDVCDKLLSTDDPDRTQQIHRSTIIQKKSAALGNIGTIFNKQGDYPKALDYYFMALKLAEESEDKIRMANILSNIGIAYEHQGDYPRSLDYSFRALKMFEELGTKMGIAANLGNIGNIYSHQGDLSRQRGAAAQAIQDYSKALDYLLKALKLYEELENKRGIANQLGNIGGVYDNLALEAKSSHNYGRSDSLFNKGLYYFFKGLKMAEESGNKQVISKKLGNLGIVYSRQGDYSKALDYCFRALKMTEEIGDKNGIESNLAQIGSLYAATKKYGEAEKYLLRALTISDTIGALDHKMQIEIALSELYTEMGKDKKALEHYKKAMVAKDTLFNEEKDQEITRKEMNYEFEKKESATKAEQDKKHALAAAEIKRQTLIKNSTLGGIGIAGIFSFLLIRSFNRRRKTSFEKQVSEVEMKALRAQMNPHFIFNSLRSINEYIQSHKTTLASEYLIKFSKLMRAILENSRQKEIVLSKEMEVLELYMELESQRMEHPFTYTMEIDPEIDPDNTLIPPMLLQPIVENSIWHGLAPRERPGKIIIRIKKQNETIQCEVEDDGIGREASSFPDKESKAESYGLKITAERLAIIEQVKKIKTHLTFHDLNRGDNFTGLNVTFALPLEEAV